MHLDSGNMNSNPISMFFFYCLLSPMQTALSYIQSHEHAIIDTGSSPGEPCDIFHSEATEMGGGGVGGLSSGGKRKLPER